MKSAKLSKLEQDNTFKKKYLPRFFWFRKAAIYPPSLVIFVALFGLVYLLNYDLLISLYAIPFAIILLLGAVWLKAVKRYIMKDLFAKDDSFLISLAKVAHEENSGLLWTTFTTSDRRHDKYYPEAIKKNLLNDHFFESDNFLQLRKKSLQHAFQLPEEITGGKNVYLKAFKKHEIIKNNASWTEEDVIPVLFIDNDTISLIKKKDVDI